MIEVLKQALEFIERVNKDGWILADFEPQMYDTITSLRQAIAELESQEPACPECKAEVLYECVACSRNNYPPQRTEPPDWFPAVENILNEYGLQAIDFVADFKAAMKDAEKSQRTWVGLTDDEVNNAIKEKNIAPLFTYRMIARTIEAKLKERNDHSI